MMKSSVVLKSEKYKQSRYENRYFNLNWKTASMKSILKVNRKKSFFKNGFLMFRCNMLGQQPQWKEILNSEKHHYSPWRDVWNKEQYIDSSLIIVVLI